MFMTRLGMAAIAAFGFIHSALAEDVVIGHFGDPLPVQAAIAADKFTKATGWKIDWRKFNSGADVIAAMASGDVKISELGSAPFAIAASQGVPIEAVLISFVIGTSESLIVRNGAGINTPADLKGKRIATPIGSTAHLSLMGALRHWKISEKDVQIIGMQPDQIAAAWEQKVIDAAFIWYPVQGKLLESGKRMASAADVAKWGYPTFNVWAVNKAFAASHRDAVLAFVKTMNEANADYVNNKAAWTASSAPVKAIVQRTGAVAEEIPEMLSGNEFLTAKQQVSNAWLGGGAAKSLKETADFLKSVGRIDKVADNYGPFIDASFAKDAAR